MQYSNSEKILTEQRDWQKWQCSFFRDILNNIQHVCSLKHLMHVTCVISFVNEDDD